MSSADLEITRLLCLWHAGDPQALDQLVPLVYDRLRRLAHLRLQAHAGHSLDTTGLVHEAYLKLADGAATSLRDRNHFLALASRVMRQVLVDQARARHAAKRGGGAVAVDLSAAAATPDLALDDVLELDEALRRLEALNERQSRILEQRYFGGLSLEETADALGVSLATVKRELRSARAWLALELRPDAPG
ncbi:MAG TPA: ECF-type sigma factor [Gemmatimonadales bacterium]